MPFGPYRDFSDCVLHNHDKRNPEAYCGTIQRAVEGKQSLTEQDWQGFNPRDRMFFHYFPVEAKPKVSIIEDGKDKTKELMSSNESKSYTFYTNGLGHEEVLVTKGKPSRYFVTGYISTPDVDLVNDLVTPQALAEMLQQLKGGTIPLKLDVEHESVDLNTGQMKNVIPAGMIVEARQDDKGLWVKGELNAGVERFGDVWNSVKSGFLDAFSITFRVKDRAYRMINGVKTRIINSLDLLNVALTGTPVNPQATITEVFAKAVREDKSASIERIIADARQMGESGKTEDQIYSELNNSWRKELHDSGYQDSEIEQAFRSMAKESAQLFGGRSKAAKKGETFRGAKVVVAFGPLKGKEGTVTEARDWADTVSIQFDDGSAGTAHLSEIQQKAKETGDVETDSFLKMMRGKADTKDFTVWSKHPSQTEWQVERTFGVRSYAEELADSIKEKLGKDVKIVENKACSKEEKEMADLQRFREKACHAKLRNKIHAPTEQKGGNVMTTEEKKMPGDEAPKGHEPGLTNEQAATTQAPAINAGAAQGKPFINEDAGQKKKLSWKFEMDDGKTEEVEADDEDDAVKKAMAKGINPDKVKRVISPKGKKADDEEEDEEDEMDEETKASIKALPELKGAVELLKKENESLKAELKSIMEMPIMKASGPSTEPVKPVEEKGKTPLEMLR